MRSHPHAVVGYLRSLLAGRPAADGGDRDLLDRFRVHRDGAAFAELLHRHGPRVLGVARRVVGEESAAEDVFQATFLLLARQAGSLRRADAVGPWLSRTAFRLALRVRRGGERRRTHEARVTPPSPHDPLDELTARELLAAIEDELERLPERYRWPLVLCCLEGQSQEEAARHLGCSPGAVRGRLERGRERLRLRLAARGVSLSAALAALLVGRNVSAIPTTLRDTTLKAALTGVGASPAAAALAKEALLMALFGKLKAVTLAVLLVGVVGLGLAALMQHGSAAPADPPAPGGDGPRADAPAAAGKDPYADALPDGAVLRLGTLRQRAVNARLAFGPDGKTVVGVRGGRFVSVWDAETGKLKEARDLGGDDWSGGALSPGGKYLAVAGQFRASVVIWDAQAGKQLHTLPVPNSGHVYPFVFSADGKNVAAVGNGRGVRFVRAWRLEDGKEVFAQDVKTDGSSHQLAFSPDGRRLLASFMSGEHGTYCWDFPGGALLWQDKELSPHNFAFTADRKVLAPNRAVDLDTGEPTKAEVTRQISWESRLAVTPDGKTLLVSGADGVLVWDLATGKERHVLKGAGEDMVISPDGKSVVTSKGLLQRWDLATGKPLWEDTWELGHAGEVTGLALTADGKRAATASIDGSVRLWDLTAGKPLGVWASHMVQGPARVWRQAGVTALDLSPDGRWLLSAGDVERVRLIDTASGKEVRSLPLPDRDQGEGERLIDAVRVSPDGARLMAWFRAVSGFAAVGQPAPQMTEKTAVWDARTGDMTALHKTPMGGSGRAVAPDGKTILVGGAVRDVASGATLRKLDGVGEDSSGVPYSFSADGALVVGGFGRLTEQGGQRVFAPDGVRVWEAETGQVVARLKTRSWVAQVGFAPNGRFVVTNDLDGIQVWDARTGEVVLTRELPGQTRSAATSGSYAGCFAFTPDGQRLLTGHPDGTVLVWPVELPAEKPDPLTAKAADELWADLKADADNAWRAAWRLADSPDVSVPLLRERLKPLEAAPPETTAPLLKDLDSDAFTKRQAALDKLKELGPRAEPALRKALEGKPSVEQKRLIDGLLETLTSPGRALSTEELRELRAVAVLEQAASAEARRLLQELAKGLPSSRLTQEAKSALRRSE